MGYLNRFQGHLLPYTYTGTIQEIPEIPHPRSGIPVQGPAIQFVHSTHGVISKEVKLIAIHKELRIHQYLDDWLVRARSHQACFHHPQELVKICQQLGQLVNLEKSELEPKQDFDFVDYQFDLRSGQVRLTPDQLYLLSLLACPVREFMSLIGLLTATEKQVHLGRLHMKPIQWYLKKKQKKKTKKKKNWRVPESLEKGDLNPQVPATPFTLVAEGRQYTYRPTVTPNITCSANIYRGINRRVGRSLRRAHCKRNLVPSGKQAAYKLSGTVFLALKEFQDLCSNKIVLVATDNTTVVSYINKEA